MRGPAGSILLFLLPVAGIAFGQDPAVLFTRAGDLKSTVAEAGELERHGVHVSVIAAPGCMVVDLAGASKQAVLDIVDDGLLYTDPVEEARINDAPKAGRPALRWLNALLAGDLDRRSDEVEMDWSAHPHDALARPSDTRSEGSSGMLKSGGGGEAIDWSCGNSFNSEYLWGTVVASVFFLESSGSVDPDSYSWTQTAIDEVKLQMIDTWSIFSYTAGLHGRSITAIMDWYEPSGGIPVQPFEPITRSSGQDGMWIAAVMDNLGVAGSGVFGRLDAFHHGRRGALDADHAFSAFIAYNPAGAPTQFTDGKIGYAYLGGPYTQLLYRANGWSPSQINRVYGHETGHIFHAFDEYSASSSSNCTRYFNGEQNANYQGSTCLGSTSCMMVNNSFSGSGATRQWNLCGHTPHHLGWTGMLNTPQPIVPINDQVVMANPVILRWDRMAPPAGVYGYVKVFDRATDELVWCGYVGEGDSAVISLVNGQYRWIVSQGHGSDSNGYAGVQGPPAEFTVNAPLNASFAHSTGAICAGATVTFTDQSTGAPTSWAWQFTGGMPASFAGQDPPSVVYEIPGTYDVALTVGDGITTDMHVIIGAVTVTGGGPLPHMENFDGGIFPPTGWTSQASGGTGGQGGQGTLSWQDHGTGSCAQGISAYVDAYSFTGYYASPRLISPKLSLIQAVDPYLGFRWSYARESATPTESLNVSAHDCTFSTYTAFTLEGPDLFTNDGAFVAGQPWVPTSCAHWKNDLMSLAPLQNKTTILEFRLDTQGGQNLYLDDITVFEGCRLNLRAMLDGPFDGGSGMMNDALRAAVLIPMTEPYSAAGHVFAGEGGGEVVAADVLGTTGNDAIVDWVLVEIRDATDPTAVLTSRAVLIQRDGDVVDVDGTSQVRVGVPAGNYHVAIKHRDHLGVMTASPVALSQSMPLLDFTLPATATWGSDARKVQGPVALLWAGDARGNGDVKYTGIDNDRDAVLMAIGGSVPTTTVAGYLWEDVNMDGMVKYTGSANDRDLLLQNIGGSVPTQVRLQQIP